MAVRQGALPAAPFMAPVCRGAWACMSSAGGGRGGGICSAAGGGLEDSIPRATSVRYCGSTGNSEAGQSSGLLNMHTSQSLRTCAHGACGHADYADCLSEHSEHAQSSLARAGFKCAAASQTGSLARRLRVSRHTCSGTSMSARRAKNACCSDSGALRTSRIVSEKGTN